MRLRQALIASALALLSPAALATTFSASISFSPPHPATRDRIIATLTTAAPTCGGNATYVVNGGMISINTIPAPCGVMTPTIVTTLAPLSAGTYTVEWLISQQLVATTQLAVAQGVDPSPALGPAGLLLLAGALAGIAWRSFRARARDRRLRTNAGC